MKNKAGSTHNMKQKSFHFLKYCSNVACK